MAGFVDNVITEKGFKCISDAIAGKDLTFSCIKMGSGFLPDDVSIDSLDDLINVEVTVEITKCERLNDHTVVIGGLFTNDDRETGFDYRELGLFAYDPDTGEEILFSYGNCGEQCEFIPPSKQAVLITKQIDLITHVGRVTSVKIELSNGLYVTVEEFEDLKKRFEELQKRITDLEGKIKDGVDNCKCKDFLENQPFLDYVLDGIWDGEYTPTPGGSSGVTDYSQLTNLPTINGATLKGSLTGEDIGLQDEDDYIPADEIDELF